MFAVRCIGNGIYHLRLDPAATKGRASVVQRTVGYAPPQIAVATRGRRVALVYGDPADSGHLTVRTANAG